MKKKTENQSIAAVAPRRKVGSANPASTATPGTPSISARSDPPIATLAASDTASPNSGIARWRWPSWRRQHQTVHRASGQAGHKNHSHSRPSAVMSRPCARRQAQLPVAQASMAAATVAAASQGASNFNSGLLLRRHSTRPNAPHASAIAGAPQAASSGKDSKTPIRAGPLRWLADAAAHCRQASAANCASSGVVSCPSCSRPSVAITASSAPSAIALA